MSQFSPRDIEQIASLARLALTDEEKKRYAEELSVVFEYVAMLNEVDTSSVEETCQVTGLEDITRDDIPVRIDEETRKKLLASFPERMGDLLKVKAIFTE